MEIPRFVAKGKVGVVPPIQQFGAAVCWERATCGERSQLEERILITSDPEEKRVRIKMPPSVSALPSGTARGSEFASIFKVIDKDKDGSIGLSDITLFFKESLQTPISEKQAVALLLEVRGPAAPGSASLDKSASPSVSFTALMGFVERLQQQPLPQLLQEVFRLIDSENKGYIEAADLSAFAAKLHLPIGTDAASELLSRGRPTSGGGTRLNFEEFCETVKLAMPSPNQLQGAKH